MDDATTPLLYGLDDRTNPIVWTGTPAGHAAWLKERGVLESKPFPLYRRVGLLCFLGFDVGWAGWPVFFEVRVETLGGGGNLVREPKPVRIIARTGTYAEAMTNYVRTLLKIPGGL